ncbi:MAG: hypothetical protein DRI26_02335 [Chloroflexi bacterium]|nr:MAG: hypothetical protein DRI26_02335 [Chloroflexota bacterium]
MKVLGTPGQRERVEELVAKVPDLPPAALDDLTVVFEEWPPKRPEGFEPEIGVYNRGTKTIILHPKRATEQTLCEELYHHIQNLRGDKVLSHKEAMEFARRYGRPWKRIG